MLTRTRENELDQTKFELRNYQRKIWNAKHALTADRTDLKAMIHAGEGDKRITRQKDCCKYWQKEIDKLQALIFKVCLKTGLTSGWPAQ